MMPIGSLASLSAMAEPPLRALRRDEAPSVSDAEAAHILSTAPLCSLCGDFCSGCAGAVAAAADLPDGDLPLSLLATWRIEKKRRLVPDADDAMTQLQRVLLRDDAMHLVMQRGTISSHLMPRHRRCFLMSSKRINSEATLNDPNVMHIGSFENLLHNALDPVRFLQTDTTAIPEDMVTVSDVIFEHLRLDDCARLGATCCFTRCEVGLSLCRALMTAMA